MKIVKGCLRGLDYVEETCLVVLLAFMSILNFANVVSRYVFSASLSYTEELTIMAFVWITMLASATAYKRSAHLGMSFIVERFPRKVQAIFVIFSMLCSVLLLYLLIKYGIIMVQNQIKLNKRTPALDLPAYWQGLSIPVGGAFMMIRTLEAGVQQAWKTWKEADEK